MSNMTPDTPRRATNVRGYNKTVNKPPLTIPAIPATPDNADYTLLSPITLKNSSQTRSLVSDTPHCQDVTLDATRRVLPTPPPSSAFNVPPPPGDCRLRAPRRNKEDKLRDALAGLDRLLHDMPDLYGIEDIGELFRLLLYLPPEEDSSDSRSPTHIHMVAAFLGGHMGFLPSHLVNGIYNHRYSFPSWKAKNIRERELAFSTDASVGDIHYARPAISSLASQIVGEKVHQEVGKLAKDSDNQIRAGTKGRGWDLRVGSWDDVRGLNIQSLMERFSEAAPLTMYMLECMCAPKKNGVVVVRTRRPYYMVSS
jgi:hypothetical protein